MVELQRRADRAGRALTSVASHPGYAATNLLSNTASTRRQVWMRRASATVNRLVAQPAAHGALPSLYAATMPDVSGGEFFGPHAFGGSRGFPTRVKAVSKAYDEATAAQLWERSVALTEVEYKEMA
jgi:hypothetical protein